MNIELSKKQFRRLLDLVYIGNWILNSTRGDQRFKDYDDVESLLFARAALETGADYILVDDEMMRDERFAAFFEEGCEGLIQQAFPLLWTDGFTRIYQIC